MSKRIVVAITGASGALYATRLVEVLLAAGCEVHLSISAAAQQVLRDELGLVVDIDAFAAESLGLDVGPALRDPKLRALAAGGAFGRLHYHAVHEIGASIASGSFRTDGMVVCPCSGATLSAIVHGAGANVIHRAAEVHLKERRRLILVPRETPLSLFFLDNLKRASEAGAVILPAMPGFYHGPQTIGDVVDFIVARICDQLDVPNELARRWEGE